MTDGRGLGQGQPIGGHQSTYQTTVQVSGWELGQAHTSRYTSADIPGHSTGQWLLMTHRFRGIFRRLGQRDRWAGPRSRSTNRRASADIPGHSTAAAADSSLQWKFPYTDQIYCFHNLTIGISRHTRPRYRSVGGS